MSKTGADEAYRAVLYRFIVEQKLPINTRSYQDGGLRHCLRCGCIKPDRAHHCIVCGKCILRFDHHCPMVNNCISYSNYKSFLLFLGYGFALSVFGTMVLLPSYIEAANSTGLSDYHKYGHVFFLFYLALLVGIATGGLGSYHLYLTAMNQTTVEAIRPTLFPYGYDRFGFYLGVKRNFLQVFGSNSAMWFMPPFSADGDGITWPLKKQEGEEKSEITIV